MKLRLGWDGLVVDLGKEIPLDQAVGANACT